MIFSKQLSKIRKEAKFTQEDLAEKCDVSRQAIAKWENGESVPDVYKMIQIARIFEISLDELILGENREETQKETARKVYKLFVKNLESLRSTFIEDTYASDMELATALRTEIKQSRLVFHKSVVDELLELSMDFGLYKGHIINKEEYSVYFKGVVHSDEKSKIFCEKIIPDHYARIEEIIGEYINLP